jgi:menaquinone-dependent protoporphyrinogen oxidase
MKAEVTMPVLVAYASKHGATRGIAERIAVKLTDEDHPADARSVQEASGLEGYDAFVIGSATYGFHWMDEALAFVKLNSAVLARHPVWLFSSGPLGNEARDAKGQDLRTVTVPKEISELQEVVQARGHRVFFGALDPDTLGFAERALRKLPAARAGLPEGDFRDWAEIDAWAGDIAHELARPPAS